MAALMGLPVIYVFTHDSVLVGEDGPTHQPVEHLAALRAIPGLLVLRPGDAEETIAAWKMAIEHTEGPSALILTRQSLVVYPKTDSNWQENLKRGAYIVVDSDEDPEVVMIATGSEVNLALEVKRIVGSDEIRIISMMSRELFLQTSRELQTKLIPETAYRVVLEAGVSLGWGEIAESDGMILCIDRFGESGPGQKVAEHLGLSSNKIA
ncbi:unnamed protein product, partial [marine sediment metagenome]